MPTAASTTQAPRYMQGIAVPAEAVNPSEFFALTRRHIQPERTASYTSANPQTSEVFELRKADILSDLTIRFVGQVVVAGVGAGTCATTARWPYDFIKAARFSANGASNLINVSGAKLKARSLMKRSDLTDRGVPNTMGSVARTQGTMALASESWGVGSASSGIANGTYAIDLEWHVPVAEDQVDLAGAIFLQTATADLTLTLDFAPLTDLFILAGGATAVVTGAWEVVSTKFSIPISPRTGQIVVPDLSVFHSMLQSRYTALQNGENEIRISGQGAGKSLLRMFFQTWNGAGTANAPLAMTTANYGSQSWRYAGNETPDTFPNGSHLRIDQERRYNADIGGLHGFGVHDFAHENAFRDVVDMATVAELRILSTIQTSVTLSNAALEYVLETVFLAGQGV